MKFALLAVLALALAANASSAQEKVVKFHGHKVHRVIVENETHASFLRNLELPSLDFWTDLKIAGNVDIMVSPEVSDRFTSALEKAGISHSVMIKDVQKLIDQTGTIKQRALTKQGHGMDWTSYHPLEDMYAYFDYLESTYDEVSTEVIGQSYEGRDQRIIKICKGGCGNKPAIYIEGGIHAREWISPAVVTYMVNELTENIAGQEDLVDNLDWYVLPSVNPDGYAYTQSTNRMWRKTRSQYSGNSCTGTDPNRNFDYHWNDGGSSGDSCSDSYRGPSAFSEIETANVRDWVLARKDKLMFFNDVHSYSQLVLLPWGFTTDPCPDYDRMMEVFTKANDALYAEHQKTYEVGCTPCILYEASGIALDWGKGGAGIKYSTSMELRDTGFYGFLLPPEQIIPTSEEVWAFHKSVARDIIDESKNKPKV